MLKTLLSSRAATIGFCVVLALFAALPTTTLAAPAPDLPMWRG